MHKKNLTISLILLGLILLIYGVYKNYSYKTPAEILNQDITKSIDKINFTPLFFKPAVVYIGGPEGFGYRENSLVVNQNLLSFEFINKSGTKVVITQQKKPENFLIDEYPGRIQLNVSTGKAVIGQNKNNSSASIFGDKTFLFLRSEKVIDDDTIKAILSAFSTKL